MYWNAPANANDLEMVLEAFRTNTWQEYVGFGAVNKSVAVRK